MTKILDDMPSMTDGREYLCSYLNPQDSPDCEERSQDAVELEICMLYHGLYHYVFFSNRYGFSNDYLIKVLERILELTNFCYDDGNYGRMWRNMLYTYVRLAELYFKNGNIEKAYDSLELCAESANRFDAMDKVTIMQSAMFNGRKFDKNILGSTFIASTRVLEDITSQKFDIPDEHKQSERFQNIVNFLKP